MLTRRTLLGATAGLGLAAAGARWIAAPAVEGAAVPRPQAVVLATDGTEGQAFVQGLQAALGPITAQRLGAGAAGTFSALLALPRGLRLYALVDDRDAMLIEAVLAQRIAAQWHRGHHAAGAGASRHVVEGAGFLRGLAPALAARLHAGPDAYAVGGPSPSAVLVDAAPQATAGPLRSWAGELGGLLGRAGQAPLQAAAHALQRGRCDAVDRRYVSLVVDV